jgi:glucose-1-phosphate cytidylyltransferase
MKVVILAGGLGSRLGEFTKIIPKPLVKVNKFPIIQYIIEHYAKFGHSDFYICGGYLHHKIEDFSNNYLKVNKKININVLFTGKDSLTGTRLKKIEKYLNKEDFLLTYGDGIGNIDINKSINFHYNHANIMTVTAVRPPARFGELYLNRNKIINFEEKPQMQKGWINGGFFVVSNSFFKFIKNKNEMLERGPIQRAVMSGNVKAYKHQGFWQCIDTKRDLEYVEKFLKKNKNILKL